MEETKLSMGMNRKSVNKQQEKEIPLLVKLPNQRKSPNIRNMDINLWRVFSYHMGKESLDPNTPAIPEHMLDSILLRSTYSYENPLMSEWEKNIRHLKYPNKKKAAVTVDSGEVENNKSAEEELKTVSRELAIRTVNKVEHSGRRIEDNTSKKGIDKEKSHKTGLIKVSGDKGGFEKINEVEHRSTQVKKALNTYQKASEVKDSEMINKKQEQKMFNLYRPINPKSASTFNASDIEASKPKHRYGPHPFRSLIFRLPG